MRTESGRHKSSIEYIRHDAPSFRVCTEAHALKSPTLVR